ncbi:hydroxyisourate hydrolase [Cohnella sp.]|uniref:hydroxyisourate hydrolase n=1 Tax=Cohnella sp. TaxID=1883426 RepID=UPI00356A271C
MIGRLTTHVLDLSEGKPAAGMRVQLFSLPEEGSATLLKDSLTNHDGRLEQALLEGEALKAGVYELVFWAGEYFALGVENDFRDRVDAFLGLIPVRFKVTDPSANYHVPLLAAPGGYSTYRGS